MEKRNNDILYRGTTPTHSFTLPDELKEVELAALYITYRQGGNTVLEKSLSTVSGGTFTWGGSGTSGLSSGVTYNWIAFGEA